MQILGPVLGVLAFAGGLFVPLRDGSVFATLSQLTPLYGLATVGRLPLTSDGDGWAALLNLVVWGGLFVAGAAWLFRRDTERV
jgi:ABC-2 type transport system permease protein